MEERVADLERENAELRQTLIPPAPAPTEKQQGGDARQDQDAEPPAPKAEPPTQKAEPPTRKAECLLASVPRKELSACVLANGFCVGSPTECTDLGGRYDSKGCGGGGDCACCEGIPEEPTPRPSPAPTPPRPTRNECPLQRVPRKSLSACVLQNGFCVGSPDECTELGGRYDARGCGGGDECACCEAIPTEPPSPRPTLSPARSSDSACELTEVSPSSLRSCIKTGGYCVATARECEALGGTFDAVGCGPSASCGCCGDVPGDEDEEATEDTDDEDAPSADKEADGRQGGPHLRASTPPPSVGRRTPRHAYWWTPRPTFAPVPPPPPPRIFLYVRLVAVLMGLAALAAALPEPTLPALKILRWPFYQLFVCMRAGVVGACGLCFSFGDGIAESRPPRPPTKVELSKVRSDGSDDALLGDGDLNDAFAEFENEHDKNPFNLSATTRRR